MCRTTRRFYLYSDTPVNLHRKAPGLFRRSECSLYSGVCTTLSESECKVFLSSPPSPKFNFEGYGREKKSQRQQPSNIELGKQGGWQKKKLALSFRQGGTPEFSTDKQKFAKITRKIRKATQPSRRKHLNIKIGDSFVLSKKRKIETRNAAITARKLTC